VSGDSGQVVAAGSAGGSIYDLGYRHYTGPRLGRRHAVASLTRYSFRLAYGIGRSGRAKIVPMALAALAAIPAVVALGVSAIASQVGDDAELPELIRYDNYYPVIAQMVALFAAAQAPELVMRDQRHRVLVLYFTRALRRDDYALAKFAALVIAMLVLILLPQVIIFIGRALVGTDIPSSIADDLPSIPPVIAQALLTAAMLASLGLAISAWTPRRAFATIGIIAVLIIPPIVVQVAREIAGSEIAAPLTLLSPPDLLVGANDFFFDVSTGGSGLPLWAYPVGGIAWTIAALAALVWRYRRIEP
jgi:ABC-2 type transport system permease protein